MKTVAIISYNIHSNHMNYGAALHSYAFQQYLQKIGIESIVVDYVPKTLENYHIKYPIFNYCRIWHPRAFLRHLLIWGLGFWDNIQKFKKFRAFFSVHLQYTPHTYTYSELMSGAVIPKLENAIFVCESDVIWKLYDADGFDDVFFLNFPFTKGKSKVAYAPSIGSRLFNDSEVQRFKELVQDFKAISTREKQGADYISAILNQKIDWMLDPTFLLSASDYSKIANQPLESHYVLLYNCMINDAEMVKEAERFAVSKGLSLIEISNYYINKLKYHHKVICNAGIEDWLGYFQNADYVICNAFHGFCFSVIFKKQVFLFLRDDSDYRMKNITDAFGVSERLIHFNNKTIPLQMTDIDYDSVYEKLDVLRLKSDHYIKENIIST